eukprot:TRINITY_DN116_c0_g1_i1.p1 TRINITY_DN116_c0_g1~~TRINITY_DN116_c0_g1_i1.p1  ORF type:complete len:499 (+),score=163.69 TRINITY_DN116_c0_g1_i1:56-1552(+)
METAFIDWLKAIEVLDNDFEQNFNSLSRTIIPNNVLIKIAPDYFKTNRSIEFDNNSKLKSYWTNILKDVQKYYIDILGVNQPKFGLKTNDFYSNDEELVTKSLLRYFKLALLIAIKCENSETMVQAILRLNNDSQQYLMAAVQDMMSEFPIGLETRQPNEDEVNGDQMEERERSVSFDVNIDDYKVEITSLKKQLRKVDEILATKDVVIADLEKEVFELKKEKETFQEQIVGLTIDGKTKEEELNKLKIQCDKQIMEIEKLTSETALLQIDLKGLNVDSEELKTLRKQVSDLSKEKETLTSKIETLEEANNNNGDRNDTAMDMDMDMDMDMGMNMGMNMEMNSMLEVSELKTKNEQLEKEVRKLQVLLSATNSTDIDEFEKLKNENEALKISLNDIQKQFIDLQTELATVKQQSNKVVDTEVVDNVSSEDNVNFEELNDELTSLHHERELLVGAFRELAKVQATLELPANLLKMAHHPMPKPECWLTKRNDKKWWDNL